MRSTRKVGVLALVLALVTSQSATTTELFRIERSKNANVVVYEGTKSALSKKDPISASWILLAKDGARQRLTFFEKVLAYGFEVELADDAETAALRLKALKGRALKVLKRAGQLVAIGKIGGSDAVLQRVYVTTDESGAVPSVTSIELFGVDAETGAPCTEKILPK